MKTVRTEPGESPTNPYKPSLTSRLDIVERVHNLRNDLLASSPEYLALIMKVNLNPERQLIIKGAANSLVPTNHHVVTLSRPPQGAEQVNPLFDRIHLRAALTDALTTSDEGELSAVHDVPSSDVFIQVVKTDKTFDLFLVNSEGFWRYDKVEDIIPNPSPIASVTADLFMVDPSVDQSAVTPEVFHDLQVALEFFRPDTASNNSAEI